MFAQVMSVFDNLDKKQLITLSVVSIVIIVALGYYLYQCRTKNEYFSDAADNDFIGENEEFSGNSDCQVKFFYADWCGYCQKAKPHFTKFMNANNGKVLGGNKVSIEMVDLSDSNTPANQEIMNKYNIQGFPTILLIKNGKNIPYPDSSSREDPSAYAKWVSQS